MLLIDGMLLLDCLMRHTIGNLLNQTFKAAYRAAKNELRNQQLTNYKTPEIKRHHVVPICNYAFIRSFKMEENVKKAVAMRGWNPMNVNCLTGIEV
jgi:hypothetical protein